MISKYQFMISKGLFPHCPCSTQGTMGLFFGHVSETGPFTPPLKYRGIGPNFAVMASVIVVEDYIRLQQYCYLVWLYKISREMFKEEPGATSCSC